jgi:hypothetical protein
MMNGQPPVYDGALQVEVKLPLNTWNLVMTLLAEAPWKTADPLIVEVRRQIGVALEHVEPVKQPGEPASFRQ